MLPVCSTFVVWQYVPSHALDLDPILVIHLHYIRTTGCGPSRAAFQVGTLAAYNEVATQAVWSFGPETGFVGGLPPEMMTLPKALKEYAQSIGQDYATSYAGKWGLQGATWTNSPMGAGYVSSDDKRM